jgi:hypothetical protein
MESESQVETGSKQLRHLALRMTVKTVLKSPLWFGLAAIAVYFFPTWSPSAWYVAVVFVLMGFGVAAISWVGSLLAGRAERRAANEALDV